MQNGVTLRDALACIAHARQHIEVPIVLFSYFNPLLQFGEDRLAIEAKEAGVDAVLVTDLIPEEAQSWIEMLNQHELDPIFLVASTTSDERLARIAQQARGFIYAVSRAGVTGARSEMTHEAEALVQRVRSISDLPVAVGFGVSSSEQVRESGVLQMPRWSAAQSCAKSKNSPSRRIWLIASASSRARCSHRNKSERIW